MTTDNEAPPSGVRLGEVLAGKYRVERVLGVGGMGIVVLAHHIQLDEKVALKFLLPGMLGNSESIARFVREARAAVRIKSEHVARVSDVGVLETGAPYMVMEYLEGGDLARWLEQRGALPVDQAVEFVLHACVAVADAHALGIVHRDLKPANLFCVRRSDGQLSIKVLDFGISKLTDPGQGGGPGAAMTKTTGILGSPLYMSPEQMQSAKKVDTRTDLWALGIVLFELLVGRTPFVAPSVMELAIQIANDAPPSVRSFRPEVSAELEAVILRCLEKDPGRRYRNVGELAVALLAFCPKRGKASVERISGIIQSAGLSQSALDLPLTPPFQATQKSETTLDPVGQTAAGSKRGRGALLRSALPWIGALVVLGGVVFAISGGFAHKPSPGTAPSSATSPPPVASEAPADAPEEPAATAVTPPVDALRAAEAPAGDGATETEAAPTASSAREPAKPKKRQAIPAMGAIATPKSSGSNCTIVTDYDSEGQPHFKKVCK